MDSDFKTAIIELAQQPNLLEKSFDELTAEEISILHSILSVLLNETDNECITLVDTMQKARLCFNYAKVCDLEGDIWESNKFFLLAFSYLVQGGIDLSMKKWFELVSLRTNV